MKSQHMHNTQQLTKVFFFCKFNSLGLPQTASEVGISQIKKNWKSEHQVTYP